MVLLWMFTRFEIFKKELMKILISFDRDGSNIGVANAIFITLIDKTTSLCGY